MFFHTSKKYVHCQIKENPQIKTNQVNPINTLVLERRVLTKVTNKLKRPKAT